MQILKLILLCWLVNVSPCSITVNIEKDVTETGQKLSIGICSVCFRKKLKAVSDDTIKL